MRAKPEPEGRVGILQIKKDKKGALGRRKKQTSWVFKVMEEARKYGIPMELKDIHGAWGIEYEWERELRLER